MAVGPVGQSVTTGPVGPCGIIPQHEADDPIADRPVKLIETPDPVDETEGQVQIDVMKIVQTGRRAWSILPLKVGRTMGQYEYKYGGYGSRTERNAEYL